MASLSFYTTCCALLAASASARHLHRPQAHHHEHHRRQNLAPTTTTLTSNEVSTTSVNVPAASITAGDAAISDIQQIQQGLSDLPANLLSFVQAVEGRLEDMERMLIELMGSPVPSAPVVPVSPTPAIQPPLSSAATTPPPSPTSTTTYEPTTTFLTSRFTSTRVRTTTIPVATQSGTNIPVASSSTASQGLLPSGMSMVPLASGNWTLPLATSGRPAVAPSVVRTRTVGAGGEPAPTGWVE